MCFYIPTDEKEMTATEDITCYKMGRRSHSDGFVSSIQEYEYGDTNTGKRYFLSSSFWRSAMTVTEEVKI